VLSDEEASGIEQAFTSGTDVHPPLLRRWVAALLEDRRERVAHVRYVRGRIQQALTYLADLIEPKPPTTEREARRQARKARNA
jgi:hypothetical protein